VSGTCKAGWLKWSRPKSESGGDVNKFTVIHLSNVRAVDFYHSASYEEASDMIGALAEGQVPLDYATLYWMIECCIW